MYFVNPNNQQPLTNKFKQHMLSWRIQMSVLLGDFMVAMSIFSKMCVLPPLWFHLNFNRACVTEIITFLPGVLDEYCI